MRQCYDDWPIPVKSISEDPVAIKQLLEDPKFPVLAEAQYGYKMQLTAEFEASIAAAEVILTEIENSTM